MGLNRIARRGAVAGALALTACAWSGCSGKTATEFVAGISSQVQVPRDLQTITVSVSVLGQLAFNNVYPVYDGKVRLPKTLGVINSSTPTGTPINISVVGFSVPSTDTDYTALQPGNTSIPTVGNGTAAAPTGPSGNGGGRILRSSTQQYVPGQIIYLPMPLHYACYDIDCSLEANSANCGSDVGAFNPCTCKGGLCVNPTIDQTQLPPYNDSFTDSTANTCFRIFTDQNANGASQPGCMDFGITPLTIDADNCIYALPDSPSTPADAGASPLPAQLIKAALTDETTNQLNSQNLNVRVVYDSFVSEVLDSEGTCTATGAVEGYCTFPNAPQMFQLAPGICHNPLHKVTLLQASAGCAAKTQYQPICDDTTQGPPQPTLADGGNSTDGGCNVGVSLLPAPSALYLLWDRSSGMRSFFGSQALSQVLGLSLGDPVFSQTKIAFSYTPSPQSNCSTIASGVGNTYLNPLIPFQDSAQGQVAIANSLLNEGDEDGGVATLADGGLDLPEGPAPAPTEPVAPWYPEAALSGAYNALENLALNQSKSDPLNRLAVMMFFDRDVETNSPSSDCGGTSAAQVAQDALAKAGIETYVVYLKNQDYQQGAPTQWATDAQQLAGGLGSGAYFFNASVGDATSLEETQAAALASVVADLGSCVYEDPGGLGPAAILSYPDPTSLAVSYAENNAAFIKYDSVTYGTSCANDDAKTNPTWVYDNKHIRVCQNTCANIIASIEADQQHTATVNITRAAQGLPPIGATGITVSGLQPCSGGITDASIVESGSAPTNFDAGIPPVVTEDAGTGAPEDASVTLDGN